MLKSDWGVIFNRRICQKAHSFDGIQRLLQPGIIQSFCSEQKLPIIRSKVSPRK
jgi:hypothetical protein